MHPGRVIASSSSFSPQLPAAEASLRHKVPSQQPFLSTLKLTLACSACFIILSCLFSHLRDGGGAESPTPRPSVWMSTKGEHLQKWPPRRLLKFLPNWKKVQSSRKKMLFCPPGPWGAQKSFSSSRDMKNYDLGWIFFLAFYTLRNHWILLSLPQKVPWRYTNESKPP